MEGQDPTRSERPKGSRRNDRHNRLPTYTVGTPCVVTVANTEPTQQPSQMSEPDGVKDTIPKEVLVGVANSPKVVGEMTEGTILAC